MLKNSGQKKKTSDGFQKLSLRERLETDRSLRTRAVIFSLLLYLIVYLFIYYSADRVTAIAGIIPAVTVGWLFGFLPGIFTGILTFPALIVSRAMLEGELWSKGFTIGTAIAGTGAVILNAGIVGRIRDLDVRFRKSLRERKLAEENLIKNIKILLFLDRLLLYTFMILEIFKILKRILKAQKVNLDWILTKTIQPERVSSILFWYGFHSSLL